MEKASLKLVPDNKMAPVSYFFYIIGVLGTGVGVFTALAESSIGSFAGGFAGSGILLASIGILWCGLFIETLIPVFD